MVFNGIIVVVIAFVLFAFAAAISTHFVRRRRRSLANFTGPRGALQEEWWEKLKSQISLRISQEEDNTKGSRVWFSRHIERGRFHHWILIIDNIKYELRQNHTTKAFFVNVQSCILDEERRKMAVERIKFPEIDGHYVCLIGWTRESPDELKRIAYEVGENWDYSKITNNCQHYLKRFADRILVSEKAADYPWFYQNTRTEYQNSRVPPPTPEEIKAMQAGQQQILSQQNIQIQNQLNMSQVNQMAIVQMNMNYLAISQAANPAMNPALNPALNPGMNPGMGGGMAMG